MASGILVFFKMNLANLANLHQIPKPELICSLFRFKAFRNEIKFKNLDFDIFKGF